MPPTGPRTLRVTVLVTTHQGSERIGTCLTSLVRQTLAPELFEILVVQNGPECATPTVVAEHRARHPEHTIRLLETTESGAARARNLGMDASRGEYLVMVDDDDAVGPTYLAAMLAAARPGVIPATYIADVPPGASPLDGVGELDNYITRHLRKHVGRTVPAVQVSALLASNAAKMVPTALARKIRYDPSLHSGEDVPFWLGVHARSRFDVHVCDPAGGAVYYRTLRDESVSRRAPSFEFNVLHRLEVLAALARIESDDPDLARMMRWSVGGQVAPIRQYLTANPGARAEVVAAARERGLAEGLPWSRINRGTARDLALLFCFTPFLDTSALVAARRIRERGLVTDVVSQDLSNVRLTDPGSGRVAEEYVDEARILPGAAEFADWAAVRRFAEGALAEVDDLQAAKGEYRSVYSRAMAVHSHYAAAALKLRQPDIVWRAEFSDPLRINPYGQERVGPVGDDWLAEALRKGVAGAGFELPAGGSLYEWGELAVYALADEIVFTNENQRRFMLDSCRDRELADRAAAVSTVSHHPTLPPEFYRIEQPRYPLAKRVVNIGYFGVFYLTRGLTEVIGGLESLSPEERSRVRLHVFTSKADRLRLEVLRKGLTDVITVNEFAPFLDYLNLTLRFDALLVNDAATAQHHAVNPYLPSKVSDYRGSGTPVWAIHEPGSVLSTLPTEYASALSDVEGATRVLRELLAAGPRGERD